MGAKNKEAGKLVSLYEMLTDKEEFIHKILIPKIQRDYVQGRDSEKSIRSRFLNSLFEVIDGTGNEEIMLDFVFGQKEEYADKITFYPVDGQQRLTTLFLLHLYIGKRAGENVEFLRKFSYETRESSKQFCQRLQNINQDNFIKIKQFIVTQWWFTGLWRTDPTIKAMINMLDDIDAHYKEKCYACDDFKRIWPRLRDRVKFWRLILSDLNTTDELYIKMNSRGKNLTDFEHFKAMLDEYAQTKGRLSAQIDTSWTNLLWCYHNPNSDLNLDTDDYVDNGLDSCFHNLMVFYLNVEGCKRGLIDFQSPEMDIVKLATTVLGKKKVDEAKNIMERFEKIMNFFSEQNEDHKYIHNPKTFFDDYIQCNYNVWTEDANGNDFLKNDQKVFIGRRNHSDLLQEVCTGGLLKKDTIEIKPTIYMEAFFQYIFTEIKKTDFRERLRILRNIVENTEIHARELKNTLLVVDELIANGNMSVNGLNDELNNKQKDQEIFKTIWLSTHREYESLLKAIENHWLTYGNINVLIEVDNQGHLKNINTDALERFGRLFNSDCNYMLIERALLTTGDYTPIPHIKGVRTYGGCDWGRWKNDLIQTFNRTTPDVLQTFLKNNDSFTIQALENAIINTKSPEGFLWEYYLRTYEAIYSAPRAKYRYIEGKYSYYKLNANGGGGPEYYWNPYNLAVEKLLKEKGFNCEADGGGGVLTLTDNGITVDIKEHSIEFTYPDGNKHSERIPQNSSEIDIVDRIIYSVDKILTLLRN